MKILLIRPPHIPTYFNAGHHLPLFIVGEYLRRNIKGVDVICIDAEALNKTWKDIINLISNQKFNIIAIMNDFGTVDSVHKFIHYSRTVSKNSLLLTFGRLSSQIPKFFHRYDLDAIVASGDYEAGVLVYVEWFLKRRSDSPGLFIRSDNNWYDSDLGIFLEPEEWVFPNIEEIPYQAYDLLYLDDSNKFCGIPKLRELVVPVSKGCPNNCFFCEVPKQQGLRERRRSVQSVVTYIEDCFSRSPFDYVSMYAPTFTLNKSWVKQFCQELISRGSPYPWKCVTTLFHLDHSLLEIMALSGCIRISVGLETLDLSSKKNLPKLKQVEETKFFEIAHWCKELGIELNCFIILGLPGQTLTGIRHTIDLVHAQAARCRPTIYTPYHEMSSDMDEQTVLLYDRQLLVKNFFTEDEEAEIYSLAFGNKPNAT